MSEITTPTPEAAAPEGVPAAPASVEVPAGFVPQADLDRVEAQRRSFQAEAERYKAELAKATTPATPPAAAKGFDPEAFQSEVIQRVMGATAIQSAAIELKAQFPHADPSMFSAESLTTFASPEALRIAAEADHNRVQAIVAAQVAAKEAELKAQLAGGGSPGGPVTPPTPGAEPTVDYLNSLSAADFSAFDAENPGVAKRVLAKAMAGAS